MTIYRGMDIVDLGWVELNFEVLSKRRYVNIEIISNFISRLIRFS